MRNPSHRALPDLPAGDIRGWDVIAADAVVIGKVRDVVEDRSLEVELDSTTLGSLLRFQEDEERQVNDRLAEVRPHGDEQLGDVDPTVGVDRTTGGPLQHTGEHPGAVPRERKEDTRRGGDAGPGPGHRVLIPLDDARVDRDTRQVFLRTIRSVDAAGPAAGGSGGAIARAHLKEERTIAAGRSPHFFSNEFILLSFGGFPSLLA